jgi:hypothetical protein
VDVSALVDFMQCCEEINFDWNCIFPPEQQAEHTGRAGAGAGSGDGHSSGGAGSSGGGADRDLAQGSAAAKLPVCFIGAHVLHLRAPLPANVELAIADAFSEPLCYRHTTALDGAGVWAPACCTHCKATLGAARLTGGVAPVPVPASEAPVPVWFDERAPPDFRFTLQLLKGALVSTREPAGRVLECTATMDADADADGASVCSRADGGTEQASALQAMASCQPGDSNGIDSIGAAGVGDGVEGDASAMVICEPRSPVRSIIQVEAAATESAPDVLRGYSMAALVADRILRAAEDEEGEHTRRFTLATDSSGTNELAILLLSPYVTLATNQPTAMSCVAGGGEAGAVTDALKVLYMDVPASVEGAAGAGAHRLVLPSVDERDAVIAALQRSTAMLPPPARRVGALCVGYLPVAPTWD